jgi:hypothetical protein
MDFWPPGFGGKDMPAWAGQIILMHLLGFVNKKLRYFTFFV